MNSTVTIPVIATMRRQSDGSYEMAEAEYLTVSADIIARLLLQSFDMPIGAGGD